MPSTPYLSHTAFRRTVVLFRIANEGRHSDRLENHPIDQAGKVWERAENVHKIITLFPKS
jgi:hypothetical protein